MILPSCDRCGQCGCACGALPYTVTLDFSALRNEQLEGYLPITLQTAAGEPPTGCGASALAVADISGHVVSTILVEHGHDYYARPARIKPTVQASVSGGTGAALSVVLASNNNDTWGVSSVTVDNPGDGYTNGTPVTFAVQGSNGRELAAAAATINVSTIAQPPEQPSYETVLADFSSGNNQSASFTLQWTPSTTYPYNYDVSGITINNGGSGYSVGDAILWSALNPSFGSSYYLAQIVSVDDNGAILSLTPDYPTDPFAGTITSSSISSVSVTSAGAYFEEDPSAPPVVDVVGVADCGTSNATFTVTVDEDKESATYGHVLSVSVNDPGSGCDEVARRICYERTIANGQPFVLKAVNAKKLVTVEVAACHGSGACIRVVPIGDGTQCANSSKEYDGGPSPIRQIELVNGGSGYAMRGREVPQWTAVTNGWSFTPAFGDQQEDSCGLPWWPVKSFEIAPGPGVSQLDGWALQHGSLVLSPEFIISLFSAVVHTRERPTVTATVAGPGSGAALTVTLTQSDGFPRQWSVGSVTSAGGFGYSNGAAVTFSVPERLGDFGHYTGQPASGFVTVENDGSITSVTITNAGSYWLDMGVPQSVTVERGGQYYRENNALPPYVATVTASINQIPPSAGSNASIALAVESNPAHQQFGQIVSATLTNQGSGYTLLGGPRDCRWEKGCLSLTLRGLGKQPEVRYGQTVFRMNGVLGNCDTLPSDGSIFYGGNAGSVALTRGGAWDSCSFVPGCTCGDCCISVQQISICEGELTATVTLTITGSNKDGTYTVSVPMPVGGVGYIPALHENLAWGFATTENGIGVNVSISCVGNVFVNVGDFGQDTGIDGPFRFCNGFLAAAGGQAGALNRDYTNGCGFDWGTTLPGWTAENLGGDGCPANSFQVSVSFECL